MEGSCVGSTTIRGISGGERKRLAVAVELITMPSLLFMDEPTTGERRAAYVFAGLLQAMKSRMALFISGITLLMMNAGLDSSTALGLMQILQELSREKYNIIVAIHQPRTTIFELFDHLILLSRG